MFLFNTKKLDTFSRKHPSSRTPLSAWVQMTKKSNWQTPSDVKKMYPSADFLSGNRIIFNIGGNKYRLIVEAVYIDNAIIVLDVYTHAQYSKRRL